jgi:hypothetical protein
MDDALETAISNVKLRLRDFAVPKKDAPDLVWGSEGQRISIDRHQFPVPNLLLFILHGVCGFPLGWRGEKMHWCVPFVYKDINCTIAFEKFGLRLYINKSNSKVNPKEVLGKLEKAIGSAEKHILSTLAQQQISDRNITIANNFHRLDGQYHYFREQAETAYIPQEHDKSNDSVEGISEILNRNFNAGRSGSFNALAMIDAYFSRLEHFFVLALAFSNYDRQSDNLVEFVGMVWSDKLKRILNVNETSVQIFYEQLVNVKEKYRNTFAHGGFEKSGQSFYFHLPSFGAIPASMSGHRESVHFNLFPVENDSFTNIFNLFDEFDNYLKNDALVSAWQFADSGLDLILEEKKLSEMLAESEDVDSFEQWIDREGYIADMYANADY